MEYKRNVQSRHLVQRDGASGGGGRAQPLSEGFIWNVDVSLRLLRGVQHPVHLHAGMC